MPDRNNSRKKTFRFNPEPRALEGIHFQTGAKVTKKNFEEWVKSERIEGKTLEEQARDRINPHTMRYVTPQEFRHGIHGVKKQKILDMVANEGEIPERKTWKGSLEVAAIKEDIKKSEILYAEENELNVDEFAKFLNGSGPTLFNQVLDQGQNIAENRAADEQHNPPANAR